MCQWNTAITSSLNRAIFLAHLQSYFQVANLCLVTQRNQNPFPLNGPSHVQCKAVVHKSDRSGASLNIFKQIILEWIYNTLEMKMDWFNSLHRILTRPAPLHHLGILFLKTNLTSTSRSLIVVLPTLI